MSLPLDKIKFSEPSNSDFKLNPDLFDKVASEAARCIAQAGGKDKNKSTQLRKYYDELAMWEQKINQDRSKYIDYLPLIKMINAKVAYAKGRNLVTEEFVQLMNRCLKEVTVKEDTFKNCKLFFEAFMGFYKYEEELKKEHR